MGSLAELTQASAGSVPDENGATQAQPLPRLIAKIIKTAKAGFLVLLQKKIYTPFSFCRVP